MNYKPILIIGGDPKSIFFEIFFKALKKIKVKNPILLVTSHKLLKEEMRVFGFKRKVNIIDKKKINHLKLNKNYLNIIDIKLDIKNIDQKKVVKQYIKECFDEAFKLVKLKISNKFINGPITKEVFLDKKFLGVTEYIANKFKIKNVAMLIYNKRHSVCPITTHLPVKNISKSLNKKNIFDKIILIDKFYKNHLKRKPNIAVTGLNPHCESISIFNEDEKIVKPCIQKLIKKDLKIKGPFSADTIFQKSNRDKFDVIVGMYHDQVLTPLKTLYEFDAINITLGLPFIRISPDHGPNTKMFRKNKSNPLSLIRAIEFLDR